MALKLQKEGRGEAMAVAVLVQVLMAALLVLSFSMPATGGGAPALQLKLERLPTRTSSAADMGALVARDRARHSRFLQSVAGVADFPVQGSFNPFTVGLYYTRVKLGSPPKEFYVQIDTGSDILWVTCTPCNGCPQSSGLSIHLEFFDPKTSSTASSISCIDERCTSGLQNLEASCTSSDSQSSLCGYSFQYGDGSGTSGYYISDTLYFDTVTADEQTANSSASIIFGCSNTQSGDLTKPDRAVDGIFGFGQHDLSVISQLSSKGVAPKVFSHCLKGSDNGGGLLVLGEIVEPGIVYTPLVRSQPHYNLNLQSIAVNGQTLPIDPLVFTTSFNRGTIVDSGTTLAYLAEEAYDPFVNSVIASVSPSVRTFVSKGSQCFISPNSVEDTFPSVALAFEGGATLVLRPQDYLLQQVSIDNEVVWCIGWQKNIGQGITILGDLVLKDKIFVYDLAEQRIGWANYDCSLSVNVTTALGRNEFLNAGQLSVSMSPIEEFFFPLLTTAAILLVHALVDVFSGYFILY